MKPLAKFISLLTHPLLVLTYMLALMLAVNPFAFGVRDLGDKRSVLLLMSVFTTSFMIPVLGVILMRPLGLIKSLEMRNKMERIGPYIVCGVFYLWLFKNFMNGAVPLMYAKFALGATMGLFFAFFINIFTKVSAHATGMGALATMILLLAFSWPGLPLQLGAFQLSLNVVFAAALLLAGTAGVARLSLGGHTLPNVLNGYVAGALAVLLANTIL